MIPTALLLICRLSKTGASCSPPQTGELILGKQYRGNTLFKSHAEEHGKSGAKAPFDSFLRGWVGTGKDYKDGVIHFAPAIDAGNAEQFDRAFSTLEMFARNGANGKTVIRGFGDVWEQPLSDLIPERREPVSEVFSILLHNRQLYEQGKEGLWLSLPTTTEKLQAALREIGISADNPQDFFLYDYRSPQERPIKLPRDLVLSADVDELNFLAARLEKLDAAELSELNAALTNPQSDFHSIGQITDYPDNVDFYVHLPDVKGTGQLGGLLPEPFRHGGYAGGMESRNIPAPLWTAHCQYRAWCFYRLRLSGEKRRRMAVRP